MKTQNYKINGFTSPKRSLSYFSGLCFLLAIFLFLSAGQNFQYAEESKNSIDINKLDKYIKNARKEWKVPGMAVAIVKDGKVVLAKGYGLKTFGTNDKVDDKTLFAIASNTKAFGAASISILVDDGKLNWDDKVQKYLPYFQLYNSYVSAEMTIRNLLCHRSGLGTFSGDLLWYETSYTTEEIIKRAKYLKPKFSFRSGFGYSNLMYMTAGQVVASVTGKPWKEFIKERIFKPLNMDKSNVGSSELKNYKNVATPHFISKEGKILKVAYSSSDSAGAAAAINSNVDDMSKWLMLLLNNGKLRDKQILSQNGLEEMWTSHNPYKVSRRSKRMFPSIHFKSYGLGWGMSDYHGKKMLSHSGGLDGMISRVALIPESGLGLVILTNSINGLSTPLMYKILDSFLNVPSKDWSGIYLKRQKDRAKLGKTKKKLDKKNKKTLSKAKINLDEFTGIYKDIMYGDAEIFKKNGRLVINLIPSPVFISDLSYLHHDIFHLKLRNKFSFIIGGEGTVQFFRNKKGRINKMKVDIPNYDFHFTEMDFKKKDVVKKN